MSTIADCDTLNASSIMSSMSRVSEPCFVDASRLMATAVPGLPCNTTAFGPTTTSSVVGTTIGGGGGALSAAHHLFEHINSLDEGHQPYCHALPNLYSPESLDSASLAAPLTLTSMKYRSAVTSLAPAKVATPPIPKTTPRSRIHRQRPLPIAAVTGAKPARKEEPPISATVKQEECLDDDDDEDAILRDLPSSCQDFELKEMNIKMERNQSSPLIGGPMSPALSSGKSNCPSAEPPEDPIEPEDLEVQQINESFEEQQKQSAMYQSGDLKQLFYHGSSDLELSKETCVSVGTDKSDCSSVERPDRLPYAKKLSQAENVVTPPTVVETTQERLTPQLLKANLNFVPLLTPKSEALVRVSNQEKISNRRRVSEPLARRPSDYWNPIEPVTENPIDEVFEKNELPGLFDSRRHVSFDHALLDLVYKVDMNSPGTTASLQQELTGVMAVDMVESLLEATPVSLEKPVEEVFKRRNEECRAARRLDMESVASTSGVATMSVASTSKADVAELARVETPMSSTSATTVVDEDEDEASWEDLDDDVLTKQLETVKLEAAARMSSKPKQPINYFAPPLNDRKPWDPLVLPHVLEAYGIPVYKMSEDVQNALVTIGFGSATVKWFEREIVLIAFESERHASEALTLNNHAWLRLRPLSKSSDRVHKAALANLNSLKVTKSRPATSSGVALRLVEGALGMRSTVTAEKRQAEKKRLEQARAAKKNAVKWNE